MSERLFPELPSPDEMEEPALRWMHERVQQQGFYHTDDLKAHLARSFALTTPMLELLLPELSRPAFSNYVDWVTARFTRDGLHTRIGHKTYTLTQAGLAKAGKPFAEANNAQDPKAALVAA